MRIKVDFGRVFPGVIIFILGLVLLFVLAIIVVISFFFSFNEAAQTVFRAAAQLTLIPALLLAGGVVTVLSGVSWWGKGGEGWLSGIARARASEDRMRFSARVGEVIGVVISFVIFLFLYENQLRGVAFFTQDFGPTAQFYFYAPLFTGIALSLARAIVGRRNELRPFDSMNALFLAVSALWLLSVFPFDFTHLGDLFPASIQFLFGWLTNDIGRALFILALAGSLLNTAYTALLYSSVRGQLLMTGVGRPSGSP